jgi:hypothetical protein
VELFDLPGVMISWGQSSTNGWGQSLFTSCNCGLSRKVFDL